MIICSNWCHLASDNLIFKNMFDLRGSFVSSSKFQGACSTELQNSLATTSYAVLVFGVLSFMAIHIYFSCFIKIHLENNYTNFLGQTKNTIFYRQIFQFIICSCLDLQESLFILVLASSPFLPSEEAFFLAAVLPQI